MAVTLWQRFEYYYYYYFISKIIYNRIVFLQTALKFEKNHGYRMFRYKDVYVQDYSMFMFKITACLLQDIYLRVKRAPTNRTAVQNHPDIYVAAIHTSLVPQ